MFSGGFFFPILQQFCEEKNVFRTFKFALLSCHRKVKLWRSFHGLQYYYYQINIKLKKQHTYIGKEWCRKSKPHSSKDEQMSVRRMHLSTCVKSKLFQCSNEFLLIINSERKSQNIRHNLGTICTCVHIN